MQSNFTIINLNKDNQVIDSVSLSFTPNRSDKIKVLRAFMLHRSSIKIQLLVSILLLITSIIALALGRYSTWWFLALVLSFYWIALILFISPISSAEKATKNLQLTGEMTCEFSTDGATSKDSLAESSYEWSMFSQVLETSDYYLIRFSSNKNMFNFIPKRSFTSIEHQAQFRDLLEVNGIKIRPIPSINLPEPSYMTIQFITYGVLAVLIIYMLVFGFIEGIH